MSSESIDEAGGAPGAANRSEQVSEEQLRAAYEAELSRITSTDMMLQAAVSLLNIGGRRLGAPPGAADPADAGQRDLEQVRDAIDAVRALLGVLERRHPTELRPLRDALSQLQLAYAREAQAGAGATAPGQPPQAGSDGEEEQGTDDRQAAGGAERQESSPGEEGQQGPGPAEASGRLWVPGR